MYIYGINIRRVSRIVKGDRGVPMWLSIRGGGVASRRRPVVRIGIPSTGPHCSGSFRANPERLPSRRRSGLDVWGQSICDLGNNGRTNL